MCTKPQIGTPLSHIVTYESLISARGWIFSLSCCFDLVQPMQNRQCANINSCAFGLVSNSHIFVSSLSSYFLLPHSEWAFPVSPSLLISHDPLACHSVQWSGRAYLMSYLISHPSASVSLSFSYRCQVSWTFVICEKRNAIQTFTFMHGAANVGKSQMAIIYVYFAF